MVRRVTVYVDGFNLYHAIDDLNRPHLKWLDLRKLAESLLRQDEVLKEVKYFSAEATWKPAALQRHQVYIAALKARGCNVILGKFKQKPRRCQTCGSTWMGHEEKETDVQIAVHMVSDALRGETDRLILISADTDLAPPIHMIKAHRPECEVFVATPPGRFGICHALSPALGITAGRINRCLLPATVPVGPLNAVTRPPSYNPPV